MYCIKESEVKTMSEERLHERQLLFEELLPDWEARIFKVAVETLPKVDRSMMEIDDVRQEIRSAVWEAVIAFDPSRSAIGSWIYNIINQAASLVAKLQYHNMPHNADGHGMQLLPLNAAYTKTSNDEEQGGYESQPIDPDAMESVEAAALEQECIDKIRPAMNEGFEQKVFDMMVVRRMNGGNIAVALDSNPARVSAVRLKIKIAYALIHEIPLEKVSTAKNAPSLATRMKYLLSGSKERVEKEEELATSECPPSLCPQFV